MTVGIGGAFAPQWVRSSAALWIERADQQLYRAKQGAATAPAASDAAGFACHVSAEEKGLLFGHSPSSRISNEQRQPRPRAARAPRASRRHQRQGRRGQDLRLGQPRRRAGASGERVLVLDADLGLANLDVVLNLFPKITLHDVFTGKAQLEQAILPAPGGFSVMLAGSGLVEYSRSRPR